MGEVDAKVRSVQASLPTVGYHRGPKSKGCLVGYTTVTSVTAAQDRAIVEVLSVTMNVTTRWTIRYVGLKLQRTLITSQPFKFPA